MDILKAGTQGTAYTHVVTPQSLGLQTHLHSSKLDCALKASGMQTIEYVRTFGGSLLPALSFGCSATMHVK